MNDLPQLRPLCSVAARLSQTVPTLLKWSKAGKFPRCHFYGGQWHVSEEAVRKWLEELPGDPERDELRQDFGRFMTDRALRNLQMGGRDVRYP